MNRRAADEATDHRARQGMTPQDKETNTTPRKYRPCKNETVNRKPACIRLALHTSPVKYDYPPIGGPQEHTLLHNPICIDANANTRTAPENLQFMTENKT